MGVDLITVAIVLAVCALGAAVFLGMAEIREAYDIAHNGWARGHRQHHMLGSRRTP